MNPLVRLSTASFALIKEGMRASLELFKVMIPVLVVVKLLQAFDLVGYVAWPLEPVMRLVGLPAEMGLVWATALFNNIYASLIVFVQLLPGCPVTQAQATVLSVLLLVAHGLPVEVAIARRSGPRMVFQVASRVLGAIAFGWVLNTLYEATDTLQGPAAVLFQDNSSADATLFDWAMAQGENLVYIFLIITVLLAIMRVLSAIGAIELFNRMLRPLLRLVGIGPKASAITVIGLTLGLSYGGGLIIREAQSGLDRRDVFYSLTLMGLCHSLVEDTLLMLAIGGHVSGILWGRLVLALLAVALLVRLTPLLPPRFNERFLWGPQTTSQQGATL